MSDELITTAEPETTVSWQALPDFLEEAKSRVDTILNLLLQDKVDRKLIKSFHEEYEEIYRKALTDSKRRAIRDYLFEQIGLLPEEKHARAYLIFFDKMIPDPPLFLWTGS